MFSDLLNKTVEHSSTVNTVIFVQDMFNILTDCIITILNINNEGDPVGLGSTMQEIDEKMQAHEYLSLAECKKAYNKLIKWSKLLGPALKTTWNKRVCENLGTFSCILRTP